jgi:ACS family D-galactonate transporter-like MFS transporter
VVAGLPLGEEVRVEASTEAKTAPYPGYRTLWIWLTLGWVASGVDRTITGPVMSYMIDNNVPLLQGVENRSPSAD